MADFTGSQELGGVYVKIGADLSGLQAGVAQARQLASSVQNIRTNVPLLTGPGMVGGASVGNNSGVNTGLLLSAPGGSAIPPYGRSNTGNLNYDFEGEVVSSSFKTQALLSGPGGGGGSWGGGGPAGGSAGSAASPGMGWGSRLSGLRGFRMIGGVFAAYAGSQTASAGINAIYAATASTSARNESDINAGREAIRGIPYLGGMIDTAGYGIYSLGSATKNLFTGGGFRTDYGIAENTMDAVARQEAAQARTGTYLGEMSAANAGARDVGRSARLANATFNKTDQQSAAILAHDELDQYKKNLQFNTPETSEAVKQLSLRASNMDALASEAAWNVQMGKANDYTNAIRARSAFGQDTRDFANDVPWGISQSKQRQSGDSFGANRAAVDRQWQQQYGSAVTKFGADSDTAKVIYFGMKQALSEIDTDRARGQGGIVFNAGASATTSGLIANRQFGRAALANFDQETTNTIAGMMERGDDAKSISAMRSSRTSQRNDLWKEQQFDRTQRMDSLANSITAAQARGRGFNVLAGIDELIGDFGGAMRAESDVGVKGMTAKSQNAKLQSLLSSLQRPTHYATELNRGMESPGGPSGQDKGSELIEINKAIRDYLKTIAQYLSPNN